MQHLFLSMQREFQLLHYSSDTSLYIHTSCIKNNVLLRGGKATFNKRCVTCSSHDTRLHPREKLYLFVKQALSCNKPIRKVTHKYHAAINNFPFLMQEHIHNSKWSTLTKNSSELTITVMANVSKTLTQASVSLMVKALKVKAIAVQTWLRVSITHKLPLTTNNFPIAVR